MIDYRQILRPTRLRRSTRSGRNILIESESDRGRVLFSPAFRRLQQKAQVFSMEPNAAVRSRLTHSIEVSQIGRYLADEVCQRLASQKRRGLDAIHLGSLVNFVEAACLMHDIGNPPFGHFGESAIQEWFKSNGRACLLQALGVSLTAPTETTRYDKQVKLALTDFEEFDGNPQGLRIAARLQWNTDQFGLNLTKTTLAAFLKYVRSPQEPRVDDGFRKKPGYFATEAELVKKVWGEFGYSAPQRFPLTYIMEAADDIAYCISDLEDSFEKKIVNEKMAASHIRDAYQRGGFSRSSPCHRDISEALRGIVDGRLKRKEFTYTDFRTKLNNALVHYAADQYIWHENRVEAGELKTLLPESDPPGFILKVLKDFCREHVYNHVSVQRVELAGYNAIFGLLEQFKPLLTASSARFADCMQGKREDANGSRILLEPKLLKLFPERYKKVYEFDRRRYQRIKNAEFAEWILRAHLVVDFVSGMTDDFAMTTYRTLAGMEL